MKNWMTKNDLPVGRDCNCKVKRLDYIYSKVVVECDPNLSEEELDILMDEVVRQWTGKQTWRGRRIIFVHELRRRCRKPFIRLARRFKWFRKRCLHFQCGPPPWNEDTPHLYSCFCKAGKYIPLFGSETNHDS